MTYEKPLTRQPQILSRRILLRTAAAISALGAIPSNFSRAQAAVSYGRQDFLALSQILTVRDKLNPEIAARISAALSAKDANFTSLAERLFTTIKADNFSDMRKFNDFADAYPDLKPTAMTIISAWYLGYIGTPSMSATPAVNHPVDDAQFVSYAEALMYEPTIDTTVIPTYSRGHTNYWIDAPKNVAAD
ncbi:sugar dehydrogenase complex small subunit [Gluconobacter kanchanaburiensis]|uniref:Sorbitol dehydrogenase n=1 Tax=Gluconobacter kanchanaburiensis NBRC 103587 TaxID=1307948 RepID=A0A511BB75_9PROT|nr:sugar dehydrogenase complex small subunit [Gluconobacter kanchanaburiensis]MBF0862772.1 hypothetical protein [Gluconobacter kanchanaburiensis]GBR68502.1 membrane bound FAD containing D-sorbitol dehydrogenase [Gluconobacter kanchanaburiensis NBRC 103587]GEK97051.1 hypothetical protein GKA01_22480 [Gluconobacter kanchanaburiensis NBRC 103587]